MGTLPSNVDHNVPTIGFISHYDTSPDFTAKNVNPKIIENYDAEDIILNSSENIILSPEYFEDLLLYKGQTLVTTDGTTLLGADDKAGVCEIVSAMEYLIKNPKIKHGTLKVGFTPDEEIGRGIATNGLSHGIPGHHQTCHHQEDYPFVHTVCSQR